MTTYCHHYFGFVIHLLLQAFLSSHHCYAVYKIKLVLNVLGLGLISWYVSTNH